MKALVLVLALVSAAASATILVEGVNDKPPPTGFINANYEARMFVHPDAITEYDKPRYLNFQLTVKQWLGDTELGILIELPENEWPGDPYFKLRRGDDELIAEDYIEQMADHESGFLISIPALDDGEIVRISIGWYEAEHENYGAVFHLNSDAVSRSLVGTWEGDQFKYVPRH